MAIPTTKRSARRTPTLARIFAFLLMMLYLSSSQLALAQSQSLGEADLIRLAKAQDPSALVAKAEVAMARAEVAAASLRENPSLSFDHEHFPSGDPSESEHELVLTLPIDLSSRISSRKKLAKSGIATASALAAKVQGQAVTRSLQLFYRLLAEQEIQGLEEAALEKLSQATQIVTRQKEAGKVSGYDQIRIEIELEIRQSELRQTRLKVSQLKAELAGLLGLQGKTVDFAGSLNLKLKDAGNAKPPSSLTYLRMAASRASQARKSAKKAWLPTLGLSAGPRLGLGEDTRFGFVAGISVELPFYTKNEALRAQTRAQVSITQARVQAAERIAKRDQERALAIMKAAHDEASRFETATGSRVDRLERAAASRYREGQSIIELLDAQRTRSEVGHRRLKLRLLAKEAELSLRAARGEFE